MTAHHLKPNTKIHHHFPASPKKIGSGPNTPQSDIIKAKQSELDNSSNHDQSERCCLSNCHRGLCYLILKASIEMQPASSGLALISSIQFEILKKYFKARK